MKYPQPWHRGIARGGPQRKGSNKIRPGQKKEGGTPTRGGNRRGESDWGIEKKGNMKKGPTGGKKRTHFENVEEKPKKTGKKKRPLKRGGRMRADIQDRSRKRGSLPINF